jgi:hypothetical protein
MIFLPNVTIVCLTNQDFEGHKRAIDKSCEGIDFGGVKIIWDEKCTSIDIWNEKIIKELPRYVDTSHALLIHGDGYVIHPEFWREEWLSLDYIGAPWPLPTDDYSYRDELGELQRVGNSVSLRSKKLMDLVATRPMEYHYGNNNEDGQICCWNRKWLESQGCKFATLEQAVHFSREHEIPENVGLETFCFHSL